VIGDIEGKRKEYYNKLVDIRKKLGLGENVIFLGSIDYNDMTYFYNGAKCFINLSSYEGYPLTAMEAMMCETPIICSDNSSFKEALGNYPAYVSSQDVKDIADLLLDMVSKSKVQISRGNIDQMKSVNKLINLYETLMYTW